MCRMIVADHAAAIQRYDNNNQVIYFWTVISNKNSNNIMN